MDRRKFIDNIGKASISSYVGLQSIAGNEYCADKIKDHDWDYIAGLFPVRNWDKLHLNSGSAGVMPSHLIKNTCNLIHELNSAAPYEVWGKWQKIKNHNISRLQDICNGNNGVFSLVRNTTEGLNTIISNLKLSAGDEIIYADHDYPYVVNAIKNRAKRDALSLNKLIINLSEPDENIIQQYLDAISEKTRVIILTHMTHREGQIIPIKQIIREAYNREIVTVVDGAHMVGHRRINLAQINPDFYVSSLHKWLNAAHGTGMLFTHANSLDKIHAFASSNESDINTARQFEHLGTRGFYTEIALAGSLDFYDEIGAVAKEERLNHLTGYWVEKVRDHPNVKIHTRPLEGQYGGVASFSIKNKSVGSVLQTLDEKYNIHSKTVGSQWGSAVRISTNLFVLEEDLDQLINAIRELAS